MTAGIIEMDDIEMDVIGMDINGLRMVLEWMLMDTVYVIELGDFSCHRFILVQFRNRSLKISKYFGFEFQEDFLHLKFEK